MTAEHCDTTITFKELSKVLMQDVNKDIKNSGKMPLLIDGNGQAATFLKYRECNYLNMVDPDYLDAERIRRATIGSIRHGKLLVLDMMDTDIFDTITKKFDEIQSGLMDSILNKSILKNEKYNSLVKDSDGEEYKPGHFVDEMMDHFKLVIVTQCTPSAELMKRMYVIKIE